MNRLPDGSVIFPRNGDPPPDLSNFDRDPGDPYHFIPKFEPCIYREVKTTKLKCGKTYSDWHCKLKLINLSISYCRRCNERCEHPTKD